MFITNITRSLLQFAFAVFVLYLLHVSSAMAWQSTSKNSREGIIHMAWIPSIESKNISLVVACIQNQHNATISISTSNLVIGQPNHTENAAFSVGKGTFEGKGNTPSLFPGRIREDGMGLYVGEGYQGIGMIGMFSNNDWVRFHWKFSAPTRGAILNQIFGPPSAKPLHSYTFNLRGFRASSQNMSLACRW